MSVTQQPELTLEEWARKYGVSTLWDKGDSKNRRFLKQLDEAKAAFCPQLKNKIAP